ncbi:MAG: hypothetical protein NWF00_05230 [Candidatus Bathyarchaeota archaeon]|nr:hypothetical protein [Candidatus Bathyarchaeota archaeon]
MADVINKLPADLRANYRANRKSSPVIEQLKVAAALKLWGARGYREIGFEVPSDFEGTTFYVNVLARNAEGMVGVECVSRFHLGWLRGRVAQLRRCLPADSYLVVVFPFGVDEGRIDKVVRLVDEIWVTDKDNSKVARMMFISFCHKG